MMSRRRPAVLALTAWIAGGTVALAGTGFVPGADGGIRIVLVGDSTVTDGSGWGLGFRQLVTRSRRAATTT